VIYLVTTESLTMIDPQLQRYIETRNKRVAKVDAIGNRARISELFDELLTRKKIRVGGRSSCGGRVDPTWVLYTSWNEVVAKAKKHGYQIRVNSIKQDNKSPTLANGWWYEDEYSLETGA
jgi:hypothetical protein